MNSVADIQSYLHKHIPLSKAMEVRVIEAGFEKVKLFAPLLPNINHRETVFGGSASALAILSGWSLVNFRLRAEEFDCRVVIQRNSMSYEKPVLEDFTAVCKFSDQEKWDRFTDTIKRKGKARLVISSTLICSEQIVARFEGSFVAFKSEK